jgi:hypothetical protein
MQEQVFLIEVQTADRDNASPVSHIHILIISYQLT